MSSVPQKCVDISVPPFSDETVEVLKLVPQEIVEVLAPPFLDEIVEVVSGVSQKRVQQRSDERGKVALAIYPNEDYHQSSCDGVGYE